MPRQKKQKEEAVEESTVKQATQEEVSETVGKETTEETVTEIPETSETPKIEESQTTNNLSDFEELTLKLKEELEKESLQVSYNKGLGLIRIFANKGTQCVSRVKKEKNYFLGQFLSSIPSHQQKLISDTYQKLKIINRNEVYLSRAGFP